MRYYTETRSELTISNISREDSKVFIMGDNSTLSRTLKHMQIPEFLLDLEWIFFFKESGFLCVFQTKAEHCKALFYWPTCDSTGRCSTEAGVNKKIWS